MQYQVQLKIIKENGTELINFGTNFNLSDNIKVIDFKKTMKDSLRGSDKLTTIKEILYLGNQELKDSENVPTKMSGLEYNLIVK